ncbi:hypothetical protein C8A01DRAFT_48406 [Parachaetomium inaequale]|uniref:Kinase n=1 Tax=Parachaetomium inaequale TaxID=2588326 RepID=A0AAN6PDF1_9PEZI|nr:hypothetical protein C8A01DRAFT_48406 [Parachaetomium inaequale]
MSGTPGAGKSTMAKLLGQPLGAVVIDHDIIKSTVLADGNISFDQAAKSAYSLCWALAESMMKQGFSVIVDNGLRLAELFGFEYWYIECRVDDLDLMDERLQKRVPLRSQRMGVDHPPVDASSCRQGEESRALFRRWIEKPCRPREDDKASVAVVDSTGNPEGRPDYALEQMALQAR